MHSRLNVEAQELEINGRTFGYHYLIVDISPLPLLLWLKEQSLYPKVYWQEQNGEVERAAVGNLLSVPRIPVIGATTPPQVRFFGGRQFGINPMSASWAPFPSCAFWLPQFEVIQEQDRTYLLIHYLNEEPDSSAMRMLHFELNENTPLSYELQQRSDLPSLDQWEQQIAKALYGIKEGRLEKVVLARKTHFLANHRIDPFILLKELKARAHKATVFGFQLSYESAFIGATPEHLYQRRGLELQTDALAGTRPRGLTEEENLRIQEELLTNSKDKREFACVKQFIQSALEPLCTQMLWDPYDRVVPTTYVQHIHNRLSAVLKPHVTDQQLIETLHPTPALGGKPSQEAMQFLTKEEPFQRGWYGAPIGWISSQAADIAVAIRSALIRNQEIDLFSGTGIVRGSQALKEWEELEQKITPFKQLFE